MMAFLITVAIFVNVGIIFHVLKYGPRIMLDFLISDEDEKRHLVLTFNGVAIKKLLYHADRSVSKDTDSIHLHGH